MADQYDIWKDMVEKKIGDHYKETVDGLIEALRSGNSHLAIMVVAYAMLTLSETIRDELKKIRKAILHFHGDSP